MSDYTGNVEVGGATDVRRLPGLTIVKLAVGPMDNNAYLLRCTQTEEGLLIDAANEADRLRELIVFDGPPVSAVLTTHRHPDHWQALAEVVDAAGAAVYAGDPDADDLDLRLARGRLDLREYGALGEEVASQGVTGTTEVNEPVVPR